MVSVNIVLQNQEENGEMPPASVVEGNVKGHLLGVYPHLPYGLFIAKTQTRQCLCSLTWTLCL